MTRQVPPGFKPGQSGNPKGRPKGSGIAGELRKAIADDMPDIVKALVSKAKDGDTQAAGLLLSRICPPLKAETPPVSVPGIEAVQSLPERVRAAMEAVAAGELSPEAATAFVKALDDLGKAESEAQFERTVSFPDFST